MKMKKVNKNVNRKIVKKSKNYYWKFVNSNSEFGKNVKSDFLCFYSEKIV